MRPLLLVLPLVLSFGCSKVELVQPPGADCETDADCQSGSCIDGICAAEGLDAGEVEPGEDAGEKPDGSVDPVCLAQGATCTREQSPGCCGGLVCVGAEGEPGECQGIPLCKDDGQACSAGNQCCSLNCQGGVCRGSSCRQIDAACASPTDCCTGTCTSGKCAAVPGALCRTLGEACSHGTECCTRNCQGGACQRVSHCAVGGDVCLESADCCNGICNRPAGGGTGTCATSVTVSGATGCTMGGEPCTDSGSCCSHGCADLGTGGKACILGSGCHERGEICSKDEDCCGHLSSGVVCALAQNNPPIGRCAGPQGCQPVGNCCGAFGDSCRQACCDGNKAVCRLDLAGLPRCFGGGGKCTEGYDGTDPECCIPDGQECQFRDQCCNLAPCIQVGDRFVCSQPKCIAAGERCTPGEGEGGCCNGLACRTSGELGQALCRVVTTPGTGTDAGIPDGSDGGAQTGEDAGTTPVCAPNGETCGSASECCSESCIGGVCGVCHADGQTCTGSSDCCSGICSAGKCIPPQTCGALGATCTGTAECCSGLACDIPGGQTNGTCQTGVACGAAGQQCSAAQPCCSSLRCANTQTFANCAPGDAACTCRFVLN